MTFKYNVCFSPHDGVCSLENFKHPAAAIKFWTVQWQIIKDDLDQVHRAEINMRWECAQ